MGYKRSCHSDASKLAMIGEHRTLYRLIMDVPSEHLNLFKSNPLLDLNSLFLIVKGTLVVESFLAILLLFCGL